MLLSSHFRRRYPKGLRASGYRAEGASPLNRQTHTHAFGFLVRMGLAKCQDDLLQRLGVTPESAI
jgi:hypothetical protein